MSIETIIKKNYEEMSKKTAEIITNKVKTTPEVVLGLATGGTPIGTYENLVKMYQNDEIDFSDVTTFNLDEYIGLETDHPQSYHYFMYDNLFEQTNFEETYRFFNSHNYSSDSGCHTFYYYTNCGK